MAFKKGESGNPGGRPKGTTEEVVLLARTYTSVAIERLGYWLKSENAKASVGAATALLNRAWGMPTQAHQALDENGKPTSMKIEVTLVSGTKDKG